MARTFGRYRLVEKIAQGGMAEVFRARQPVVEGVERDVVIKRILPNLANDPEFVRMFLNEARISARFNHSNVAQIYDVGEHNGSYFIAMEYVHGADLGRVMRRAWSMGHWIARPLAIRIVACCCEGLHYAHTRTDEGGRPLKVVHRDTSPANILISTDGAVKLTDFGIAKAADLASFTRAGSIKGKFAYMSPEQAKGEPVDHRTDLFSVALVLYELLTGVRPLRRESDSETHRAAVDCEIAAPSSVSDVPPEMDALVMKALAKDPDDRYDDVHQFRMALEEFLVEQRWVATSAQIAELMAILFAEGIKPELPPGVSSDPFDLEDSNSALPQGAPEKPPPPVPDLDIYGENDPLPTFADGGNTQSGGGSNTQTGVRRTGPQPPKPSWSGPPRHLEIHEGPDAGTSFPLSTQRVVIGRVSDCHLVLQDRSISRRHLELAQTPEGVLLRDLASGNGTRVNGEDVSERLLVHGDVVELGTTKFQFVDEEEEKRLAEEQVGEHLRQSQGGGEAHAGGPEEGGEAGGGGEAEEAEEEQEEGGEEEGETKEAPPAQANAEPPGGAPARHPVPFTRLQKRLILGSAAVAAAFLLFWLFRPSHPEPSPGQQQAAAKMQQARKALAEGRREEAIALAKAAERLWPGSDAEGLAAHTRRDQEAAEGLRRARLHLERHSPDDAEQALKNLDPVSPDLVRDKQEVALKIAEARAGELEQEFDRDLRSNELAAAKAVLAAAPPSRSEAMKKRLAEAEARARAAEEVAQAAAGELQQAAEKRRRQDRTAEVAALFSQVEDRLRSRDWSRALLAVDHVVDQHPDDAGVRDRAQLLKRLIPAFGRAWEEGQDAQKRGEQKGAARSLRRARDLLIQIGAEGPLRAEADQRALEAVLAAARLEASQRDWAEAAELYKEALAISAGDARAADGLEAIAAHAGELLDEGISLERTDPSGAAAKLKLASELAKRGSPSAQRAASELRALQRGNR